MAAPEFHEEHHDLDAIAGAPGSPGRDTMVRVLEVAAALVDQERAARLALEREVAEAEAAARQTAAQAADDAGLPVDTQAALEDAISACGRQNHEAARKRLGDRLYEAIGRLGHGCCWSWLCQQPVLSMPQIARRIDGVLGRNHVPSQRGPKGGGTHFRRQERGRRVAVPPEQLPSLLLGLVRGTQVFVPLEDLAEVRLTAGDWNYLVGQVLRKVEMGFVPRHRFAAYLLETVGRHEASHRIPKEDDLQKT